MFSRSNRDGVCKICYLALEYDSSVDKAILDRYWKSKCIHHEHFHASCLCKWFAMPSFPPTCPLCREPWTYTLPVESNFNCIKIGFMLLCIITVLSNFAFGMCYISDLFAFGICYMSDDPHCMYFAALWGFSVYYVM